MAKRMEKK